MWSEDSHCRVLPVDGYYVGTNYYDYRSKNIRFHRTKTVVLWV